MPKFAKGNSKKKKKQLFSEISSGNLFIILNQLTKLEVHSFNTFGNINDLKYLLPKFAKGNNSEKIKITFIKKNKI